MNIPKTTLWLPPDILSELMFYVWSVKDEVGGLGLLSFDEKENDIFVQELYLIEQTVHSTETDVLAKGIDQLYQDLIAKGEDDKVQFINFWWHSHVDMGASFSSIDDECMRTWPGKYLVSLVINKRSEMKAMLMTRTPVLICGDIDVKVNWLDVYDRDVLEADIEAKVKTKPKSTAVVYSGGNGKEIQNNGFNIYEQRFGWDSYNNNNEKTSVHDLTEDEWKKVQDESDAMDEAEKMALKKMWGTGWSCCG